MRIRKAQLFGCQKDLAKSHLALGNRNLLPKNVTFGRTAEFFVSARCGPPSGVHGCPTTKIGSKSKNSCIFGISAKN